MFRQEAFDDFSSFKAKIRNKTLPGGYVVIEFDKQVEFHFILSTGIEDEIDAPCLRVSVIVNENLELKVFVLSTALPISAYDHLLSCKTLQTTSELTNILAFCKSLANESRACSLSSFTGKTYLFLAASFLKAYAEMNLTKVDEDFHVPLVKFIIEQLNLIGVPKNGRRYSTEAITTSFLWQLTSTSLYKTLRKYKTFSHQLVICESFLLEMM